MILQCDRPASDELLSQVMTDGQNVNDGNPMRRLVLLYMIDVLQVFRVMLSPTYGWTLRTYNVGKRVDIVYNITSLLSFIVPRYTFFGLAFLMVAFALCDAFYCARLFKAGEINQIGPIKALRFMVAVVVTTLFSSVMKWLLIPLDCLISDEESFSEVFHGEGAPCTPLAFPEILTTVPTIILVVLYVLFALTAAFFSLGTNPLSCAPHVQFTGRVEALFILCKVCSTFLPFLSDFITPVAISLILLTLCSAVWFKHLCSQPFYSLATNMLRGGIYFSIFWLSLSSVLVACFKTLDFASDDVQQTMYYFMLQWLLVGFTPMAFPIGVFLIWRRRNATSLFIDRLRGEFESQNSERECSKSRGTLSPRVRDDDHADGEKGGSWTPSDASSAAVGWKGVVTVSKPRGALRQFFDPSWERKRAFATAQKALNAIRVLLMRRNESELSFLKYMMTRALDEHPDSMELQVLNVSLLRFVFTQTSESSQAEKKLRNSHTALAADHEYMLYAVDRKAAQDYAAISIGNGAFNAINLMEFDSGMQQARTAHLQCLTELRKFWTIASGSKSVKDKEGLQISVNRLVEFNRCVTRAVVEYEALMEKYPQSSQLVSAYCSFCDTVLNDPAQAKELRMKAAALEENEDEDAPDPRGKLADCRLQAALEQQSQRSGSTMKSDMDDNRIKIQKSFSSWSASIFGSETRQLLSAAWRLKICFFLLLLFSTVGFAVMQFFLFKSYAQRDSHLINKTGLMRTLATTSLFYLRSQIMAALDGDAEKVEEVRAQMITVAKKFQNDHWGNYELARTARVTAFYSDIESNPIVVNVPAQSGWTAQTMTYWNFGTDWARRMERISTATMEELQSPFFDVRDGLSDSRLNMVLLNENLFRITIPTLEDATLLYESEMQNLWALTQTIVLSNTGAVLLVWALLLYLVVFRFIRVMGSLQHLFLACHLAHVLPHATTRKIAKFYDQAEKDARSIEDEEAMKKMVEEEEVGKEAKHDDDSDRETQLRRVPSWGHSAPKKDKTERRLSLPTLIPSEEPAVLSLNEDNLSKWTEAIEKPARIQRRVSMSAAMDKFPRFNTVCVDDQADVESDEEIQAVVSEAEEKFDKTQGPDPESMTARCDQKTRYEAKLRSSEAVVVETDALNEGAASAGSVSSEPPAGIPAPRDMDGVAEDDESLSCVLRARNSDGPHESTGSHSRVSPGGQTAISRRSSPDAKGRQGKGVLGNLGGILRRVGSGQAPQLTHDRDSNQEDDEEAETDRLPLREVSEERATHIWECVRKRTPLSARTSVWLASMAVIVGLSMLLNWFPARRMSTLVTLAPTINQAGRRRQLTRMCIHLTRELAINDGLSRMSKAELTSALDTYIEALRRANNAVRLGGDHGIKVGADERNAYHNELMYGDGCPWREDPTDCSYPLRPGVTANGLYHLSLSFMDAVRSVLDRHGVPKEEYTDAFLTHPRTYENGLGDFDVLDYNASRAKKTLEEDPDLQFVIDSFDGDLFKAFAGLVELFDDELSSVVSRAMIDNEAIFVVFVVVTFGGAYFLLFANAVKESLQEGDKARTFVARIPAHTLSPLEIETLSYIFQNRQAESSDL